MPIREVTRRDLHEGGPPSRKGTDRISRGRCSPCGPSARPGGSLEHRRILGERNVFPYRRPRGCVHTLPSGLRSGPSPVRVPPGPRCFRARSAALLPAAARSPGAPRPSAARRWKSMNVCSVRRDRLVSGALLLVGKGREKKGSLRTPPHVLASGGAARRCRSGGNGGRAGCQRRREEPYPGASG